MLATIASPCGSTTEHDKLCEQKTYQAGLGMLRQLYFGALDMALHHTYDPADPRRHATPYVVTAVMAPTGTPDDRAIFIPIEGIYRMDGHELRGSGEAIGSEAFRETEIPDEHKEVSAVLLRFRRGGINPAAVRLFRS